MTYKETAKTSVTHPLRIAELAYPGSAGKIGVTFCPGKKQTSAYSGLWDRDLSTDVAAILQWGAAHVVTLVEAWELETLQVPELGKIVHLSGIQWHHLPIVDVSIPDQTWEDSWQNVRDSLHADLRGGMSVLVHCKGGLGRAGTVAARLLVEAGVDADAAIRQVRAVRKGAIETGDQERYVKCCGG